MTSANTSTVVGVFRDRVHAEQAIQELTGMGVSRDQMSVIAGEKHKVVNEGPNLLPDENIGADDSTGTGIAVGGFFGFLVGIAVIAIPGVGPILAAGPLAAGLMGAGIGAAAGGIAGALKEANVPEADAKRYSEAVRAGGILVAAHVRPELADKTADAMDRNGAYDIDEKEGDIDIPSSGSEAPIGKVSEAGVRAARLTEDTSVRGKQKAREVRVGVYPGITGGTDVAESK